MPNGVSLADFGISCKQAPADHGSGVYAIPLQMGCKSYFDTVTAAKLPQTVPGCPQHK